MTTIAYKDSVIAYDSRCLCGSTIVDDDFDKHREVDGVHFFFTGSTSDYSKLIERYFGKREDFKTRSTALVYDSGKIVTIGICKEDGYYINPERLDNPVATGSGEEYALTAMDCGLSAKEAVKMAMKRDTGTGGRIRTFKIK